jgi:hypothetical protein
LHRQRWLIFHVDSLALLKIINMEYSSLIPKIKAENFLPYLCTRNFCCGNSLNRYACHSIDCWFLSGS